MRDPLRIQGHEVKPGARAQLELPIARLPTGTWLSLPVEVVHGRKAGPRLFVTALVHGDELNGFEIARRLLTRVEAATLKGSLVVVPVVNVFGFISGSRYLPDRRDLNRSFPGSKTGSLAARLANLLMTEVVGHATCGIDLHTGSNHRVNWPQIRGDLDDAETRRLARAFGAGVIIDSKPPQGSLRRAAAAKGVPVLLYEAGEAFRHEEEVTRIGLRGILRVMKALGMRGKVPEVETAPCLHVRRTTWVRARRTGMLRLKVQLGDRVTARQEIGVIADASGSDRSTVRAPVSAVVIGMTNLPLVHQGDAILHLGLPEN